ncbi:12441_t:CDS:2 [Acaulospora morrowiae]|uniref:12441_t:CDS:1 n=1 Tax=Acaulospora morrowiae TaxID=94023 RepID=A0A9N9FNG9_9GLOM|nr:12441_t:CDS:2 [Acaulospora morrowiae]
MSSSEGEIITKRQAVKIKPRTVKIKPRHNVSGESSTASVSQSKRVLENVESLGSSQRSKNVSKMYDDDDNFFTRNSNFPRKIDTKTEKNVKILKELEDNTHENDNLQSNDEISTKRPRNSKGKGKAKRWDWTLSDDPISLGDFSEHEDLSDFSDEMDRRKSNKGKKNHDIPDLDREPSLTPPPELNEHQIQSTVGMIRATLMQYSEKLRSDGNEIGSPGISYETQDNTELDPELLAIQQSIKQNSVISSRSVNAKVEIKVTPIRHPEIEINDANRKAMADYEKPIKFIIKTVSIRWDDNFEQMIKWLCEKKGIWKQDLVLTYKKVKVFPRSTPESLGMIGQVVMEAYTRDTFIYIREREALNKQRLLEDLDKSSDFSEEGRINDNSDASDINYVNEEDYIHLKLRSEDESVEKLKVKKSLTVQAVIDRYKKIKNIPANEKMRLLLEDETLSVTDRLEDTDLEDGDMLSVVLN